MTNVRFDIVTAHDGSLALRLEGRTDQVALIGLHRQLTEAGFRPGDVAMLMRDTPGCVADCVCTEALTACTCPPCNCAICSTVEDAERGVSR